MLAFVIRVENAGRQSPMYERMERAAYRIARLLDVNGPSTVAEIARSLELDASTVTRQVAAMEARQQVVRRVHPEDRRAWQIDVTAAGRGEMSSITAQRRARFGRWVDGWSVDDVARFGELMGRFNDAVAATD